MEQIFTEIFERNSWGGKESLSGTGSDREQTQVLVKRLSRLFRDLGTKTLLDIPCGDYHWLRLLDVPRMQYVGADVVKEMILQNRRTYERENVHFRCLDLTKDPLPKADLILCRDCLVHFSYSDIALALHNICESDATYLLTTTFTQRMSNYDIPTGKWRPLNLALPPFDFPAPHVVINEECSEDNGRYPDKSLALWELSDVRKCTVRAWKR